MLIEEILDFLDPPKCPRFEFTNEEREYFKEVVSKYVQKIKELAKIHPDIKSRRFSWLSRVPSVENIYHCGLLEHSGRNCKEGTR